MMKRISRTTFRIANVTPVFWLLVSAACVAPVTIGEGQGTDGGASGASAGVSGAGGSPSPSPGDARVDRGLRNCGGVAAGGAYDKGSGVWDGSAGNPYGYPSGRVPVPDCYGFGFHDTCNFWDLCEIACTESSECPFVEGGPPPACRPRAFSPLPGTRTSCVLPCADGSACPDGMQCVYYPYGFGDICMWLKTSRSGS